MICKIADFYIDADCKYEATKKILLPYACKDAVAPDFSVSASDTEMAQMEADFADFYGEEAHTASYIERLVLHEKISNELLSRDAFMMHGVLVEYEGIGYIFTAQSGTGKTTHAKLWKKRFGDSVHIINGDKPILRMIDGELYGYGTPWCGKEGYNINTRVKISKLCFVERAAENSIERISEVHAISRLMSQVEIVNSRDLGAQLSMLDVLVSRCDMYLLKCNMDVEAAEVAYNGMK